MCSILARNVQNSVGFCGSAPDPAGELCIRRSPDTLVVKGFDLAYGNRSFAPSALNPPLAPQTQNPRTDVSPQTQNSRTAPAETLNRFSTEFPTRVTLEVNLKEVKPVAVLHRG